MKYRIAVAALAVLLSLTASGQDLFDDASGGRWVRSEKVSASTGSGHTSWARLLTHEARQSAALEIVLRVPRQTGPIQTIALKIEDGRPGVYRCRYLDSNYLSRTIIYVSICEIPWAVATGLREAKRAAIQIATRTAKMEARVWLAGELEKLRAAE